MFYDFNRHKRLYEKDRAEGKTRPMQQNQRGSKFTVKRSPEKPGKKIKVLIPPMLIGFTTMVFLCLLSEYLFTNPGHRFSAKPQGFYYKAVPEADELIEFENYLDSLENQYLTDSINQYTLNKK